MTDPPSFHLSTGGTYKPDKPAVIGKNASICIQGNMGDTNGDNFWTVGTDVIAATDITNLTNPGNSDVLNPIPPLCSRCSCASEYLKTEAINSTFREDLERTGYAAFVVTMFLNVETEQFIVQGRMCYGVRNFFMMYLEVEEVVSVEPLHVSVTVTSAESQTSSREITWITSKSF